MANTLGGIFQDVISDKDLTTLLPALPAFSAFTTNFSADIAQVGQSVSTRVANSVSASQVTAGYTATDVTSTAKTISLDQHWHFTMAFTDLEVAQGGLPMLERVFIRPAVHALAKKLMDATLARALAAAFTNNTVIAAGSFDADAVAGLAQELSDQEAPQNDRHIIIGHDYIATLQKDNAIQAAYAYGGTEAIREGRLANVHGFTMHPYSGVPANGESLEGIALTPEALLIAARVPAQPPAEFVNAITVVEPTSGLPIQWREWYDPNAGAWKYTATLIYGTLAGQGNCAVRITSA